MSGEQESVEGSADPRKLIEKLEDLESHPIEDDLDSLLKLYDEPKNWKKLALLKKILYSDKTELENIAEPGSKITTRNFSALPSTLSSKRAAALPDVQTDTAFSWAGFAFHKIGSVEQKVIASRDTPMPSFGGRLADFINQHTSTQKMNLEKNNLVAKMMENTTKETQKSEDATKTQEMESMTTETGEPTDSRITKPSAEQDATLEALITSTWVWTLPIGQTTDLLAFDNQGSLFLLSDGRLPMLLKLRLFRATDRFGQANLANTVHLESVECDSTQLEQRLFFLDQSGKLCSLKLVLSRSEATQVPNVGKVKVHFESEFSCMVPSTVDKQLICTTYDGEVTIVDLQPLLLPGNQATEFKTLLKIKKLSGLQNFKISAVACDMNLIAFVGVSVGHDHSWIVLLTNMDLEPLGTPVKFDSDERRIPIGAFLTLQAGTLRRTIMIFDNHQSLTAICMTDAEFRPSQLRTIPGISLDSFKDNLEISIPLKRKLLPNPRKMYFSSSDYFQPAK